MSYVERIKKRRSIRKLGKNVSLSSDQIVSLVKDVVRESPTAMNAQTQRIVFLFEDQHDTFWDETLAILEPVTPEERWPMTQEKIKHLKAGFGTLLLFEDHEIIENQEATMPLFKAEFRPWSEQNHGITVTNIWNALAQENIGASLHHYNPLVDEFVREEWNLPEKWKLRGQLAIGSIEEEVSEKNYVEDDTRFKVFK